MLLVGEKAESSCWYQPMTENHDSNNMRTQRNNAHTNLCSLQVCHESESSRVAKLAVHRAPHLGRHANCVSWVSLGPSEENARKIRNDHKWRDDTAVVEHTGQGLDGEFFDNDSTRKHATNEQP